MHEYEDDHHHDGHESDSDAHFDLDFVAGSESDPDFDLDLDLDRVLSVVVGFIRRRSDSIGLRPAGCAIACESGRNCCAMRRPLIR